MKRTVRKEGAQTEKGNVNIEGLPFPCQDFSQMTSKISREHYFQRVVSQFAICYPSPHSKNRNTNCTSFTTITIIIIVEFIDKHKSKKPMNQREQSRKI